MPLHSLGRETDLIFIRFSGVVQERDDYTVVQTPSNPGYHWGNYLIFKRPPERGDRARWQAIFDREFPCYAEPQHYIFTWDLPEFRMDHPEHARSAPDEAAIAAFLEAGFTLDSAVVLEAQRLNPPPAPNPAVTVKALEGDDAWEAATQNQIACAAAEFAGPTYEVFKRRHMDAYRQMVEAGLGLWFGAFLDGRLVGDLGIFASGRLGRFQSVGTHPDLRRRGVCGTLVYQAGLAFLERFGVETLVMEADPDYHAARIYESVGFRRMERNHALTWHRKPP